MGILFDQKKLDAIHQKLSQPISDLAGVVSKYSVKYPLLEQIGTQSIPRILEQGPNVVHLLVSLLNDETISFDAKKNLTLAAAYFVWPLDLLPEGIIGPIGYLDDILVAAYVFGMIINGGNVQDKATLTALWKGRPEDLDMLRGKVLKLDAIKSAFQNFIFKKK